MGHSIKTTGGGSFGPEGLLTAVISNPRLFNHELFDPLDQKFMVEKSGVKRSGVDAWG